MYRITRTPVYVLGGEEDVAEPPPFTAEGSGLRPPRVRKKWSLQTMAVVPAHGGERPIAYVVAVWAEVSV